MISSASSQQRSANRQKSPQPEAICGWLPFQRLSKGAVLLGGAWILLTGMNGGAWGVTLTMEAEVLEGSLALTVPGLASESVHYALVHHHRSQDQSDLSAWLRSRGGSRVTFVTKDGQSHQGVLNRLKHCFGRGLLIYSDRASLAEKEIVWLELPRDEEQAEVSR